jgi:very-short-patch-repair endonuclease
VSAKARLSCWRVVRGAQSRKVRAGLVTLIPTHLGKAPLIAAVKGYQPTRSEFEGTFLAFCAQHDLPTPIVNRKANGHERDMMFPDHNLIVELDGWDYHRDRHSFESDRDRDADQLAHGQPTVRITWERITETPAKEATRLQRILTSRER